MGAWFPCNSIRGTTMGKGDQAERALSNILEDQYQMAALRAPGSGGRTQRNRPDVIASRELVLDTRSPGPYHRVSDVYAIEVKSKPEGVHTFSRGEIKELREFAARAGATALVAIKPDLRSFDSWLLMDVQDLHETPEGNYSIRKQDHADCLGLTEVFSRG